MSVGEAEAQRVYVAAIKGAEQSERDGARRDRERTNKKVVTTKGVVARGAVRRAGSDATVC
jgi:hypothetical protein